MSKPRIRPQVRLKTQREYDLQRELKSGTAPQVFLKQYREELHELRKAAVDELETKLDKAQTPEQLGKVLRSFTVSRTGPRSYRQQVWSEKGGRDGSYFY